jgi:hypothetical protein
LLSTAQQPGDLKAGHHHRSVHQCRTIKLIHIDDSVDEALLRLAQLLITHSVPHTGRRQTPLRPGVYHALALAQANACSTSARATSS